MTEDLPSQPFEYLCRLNIEQYSSNAKHLRRLVRTVRKFDCFCKRPPDRFVQAKFYIAQPRQ